MTRVRTFIAAMVLTIPMLTVSATTPVDQSAQVLRDSSLPAPQTGYCVWIVGYWWCF